MVKHIVMWKLKDENKDENLVKIKNKLENLKDAIPEIINLEIGINENPAEHAFDISLYSEFESMAALQIYQKHSEHVKAAGFISQHRTQRCVVDYEV